MEHLFALVAVRVTTPGTVAKDEVFKLLCVENVK